MKGIESMVASMMGVDGNKLKEMMGGFIDNAAYLAKGIDEIKASMADINAKLDRLETQKLTATIEAATFIESEGNSNVESDD